MDRVLMDEREGLRGGVWRGVSSRRSSEVLSHVAQSIFSSELLPHDFPLWEGVRRRRQLAKKESISCDVLARTQGGSVFVLLDGRRPRLMKDDYGLHRRIYTRKYTYKQSISPVPTAIHDEKPGLVRPYPQETYTDSYLPCFIWPTATTCFTDCLLPSQTNR